MAQRAVSERGFPGRTELSLDQWRTDPAALPFGITVTPPTVTPPNAALASHTVFLRDANDELYVALLESLAKIRHGLRLSQVCSLREAGCAEVVA